MVGFVHIHNCLMIKRPAIYNSWSNKFMKNIFYLFLIIFLFSCNENKNIETTKSTDDFLIINTYKHDINSFTEGLFFDFDTIYESTGSPKDLPLTKSVFGILNLNTGKIDIKSELDKNLYFGEGIALCDKKIFQLTYLNKVGFIYDSKTFNKIGEFNYTNDEGWGLTNIENDTLIMSDGTNVLTFLDSKSLKLVKKIYVTEFGNELHNVNELEYVDGYIYANIYTTNKIVKINSNNGLVIKSYDFSKLYYDSKHRNPNALEMNGIAYNKKTKTFFITGKMWPSIYEVKFNN